MVCCWGLDDAEKMVLFIFFPPLCFLKTTGEIKTSAMEGKQFVLG